MSAPHHFHPTVLRRYDIRGIVGETLSAADARAVGRAFATIARRAGEHAVCVGWDGRLSSPELAAALVDGLASAGLAVHRVGRGPTPLLYYATHALGTGTGIMVTGSHNPPDHNGLKMMLAGASFWGDDIRRLGEIAAAGDVETGRGTIADHDLIDAYVARLAADYRGDRPLSVAWDAGNGAAGEAMVKLTKRLPGRHVLLNEAIDGTFPNHHADPTVESNLDQLKAAVAAEGCELGIAFDGDGDRIGVIDGRGRVLWGDQLMILYAREVLADLPGATIISEVKASRALYDEIARLGGRPLMWGTGHSLIKTKMKETGAPLAGEMSGHIFFGHRYYGYDDALYAAVRLLSIAASSDSTLAAMRDAMPALVNTPELRFECPEERKFGVIAEVAARLKADGAAVVDIDGVRVSTDDGWWLLRASNTQALLVARCEAGDDGGLARLKAALAGQLRASGVEPPEGF